MQRRTGFTGGGWQEEEQAGLPRGRPRGTEEDRKFTHGVEGEGQERLINGGRRGREDLPRGRPVVPWLCRGRYPGEVQYRRGRKGHKQRPSSRGWELEARQELSCASLAGENTLRCVCISVRGGRGWDMLGCDCAILVRGV